MADLLKSHLIEKCELNPPEGLKELMSDISREVLRMQPDDIYEFISNYLAALLVSRENLTIASQICSNVCDSICHPELQEQLEYIGLSEEDAVTACDIISKFFNEDEVNESALMVTLVAKTSIEESQLPGVLDTVRKAFMRHRLNNSYIYESTDSDEFAHAAHHTMMLYKKTKPKQEHYNEMATRIETAYRIYGVRRHCPKKKRFSNESRNIRFQECDETQSDPPSTDNLCVSKSSMTLAGSYISLPKYVPYSVHPMEDLPEWPEAEDHNKSIDYEMEIKHQDLEHFTQDSHNNDLTISKDRIIEHFDDEDKKDDAIRVSDTEQLEEFKNEMNLEKDSVIKMEKKVIHNEKIETIHEDYYDDDFDYESIITEEVYTYEDDGKGIMIMDDHDEIYDSDDEN